MRQSSWRPNPLTLELYRPQNDRPAAYVIAQQYSSATLVSLLFQSRKEKFNARLKKNINSLLFKIA